MKTFGDQAYHFFNQLRIKEALPKGIKCLLPFKDTEVQKVNQLFFKKYYNDHQVRKMIIGINPGRFGAGVTGINFTDPVNCARVLKIENTFEKRSELSSDFIYKVIDSLGGPEVFFSTFFITSVSPIGFTLDNKNLNYYDNKTLQSQLNEFIVQSLKTQLKFGIDRKAVYCLGEGKNYKFISELNNRYSFFEKVVPLPHPRYIMQYKRKELESYIEYYLTVLQEN